MADYFAVQALDSYPAIDQAQAGEVGVAYGEFSITATVPLLAATDLIHMVWLPARHRVVDCIIQMDQIDRSVIREILAESNLQCDRGS